MAVASSNDDGFREIQLNGKQLVFLFMAVTVVLVVTFLTGVLVGRGVRAERVEAAQSDVATEPTAPDRAAVDPPEKGSDPTAAAPPASTEDEPTVDGKGTAADAEAPVEEPPVAIARSSPPPSTPVKTPEPPKDGAANSAKATPAPAPPAKNPAPAAAAAAPASVAPPAADPAANAMPPATGSPDRSGYAVQVAAVKAKGEAESIAKRLSGKGYAAYVESPKGSQKMFRVRVGTFKTRSEATTIANKLKKEEKFNPWVTR